MNKKLVLFISGAFFLLSPAFSDIFSPYKGESIEDDVLNGVTKDVNEANGYVFEEPSDDSEDEENVEEVPEVSEENSSSKYAFDKGYYLIPSINISILPSPFCAGLSSGVEFQDLSHLNPFFWGAGLTGEIGFPKNDFPYSYKVNGSKINSPNLISMLLYVPTGIYYGPFKNPELAFQAVFRIGIKVSSVASFEEKIMTDPRCAFYTALGAGFDFYRFNTRIIFSYDSTGGFIPEFDFSYRLKLTRKRMNKGEALNEEESISAF